MKRDSNLPVYSTVSAISLSVAVGYWGVEVGGGRFQLLFQTDTIPKSHIFGFPGTGGRFPQLLFPSPRLTKSQIPIFSGGGVGLPTFVPESKTDQIPNSHIFPGEGLFCETSSDSLGRIQNFNKIFLQPVLTVCTADGPPAETNQLRVSYILEDKGL